MPTYVCVLSTGCVGKWMDGGSNQSITPTNQPTNQRTHLELELARGEVVLEDAHVRERRHVKRRPGEALLPAVAHERVEVGVGGGVGRHAGPADERGDGGDADEVLDLHVQRVLYFGVGKVVSCTW